MNRQLILAQLAALEAGLAALRLTVQGEELEKGVSCPHCGEAENLEKSTCMGEADRMTCLTCTKSWTLTEAEAAALEAAEA